MKNQNFIILLLLSFILLAFNNCNCNNRSDTKSSFLWTEECDETDYIKYASVVQNGNTIQINLDTNYGSSSSSPSYVRSKTSIRQGSFSGSYIDFNVSGGGYTYTLTPTSSLHKGMTYYIIFDYGTFRSEDFAIFTINWG